GLLRLPKWQEQRRTQAGREALETPKRRTGQGLRVMGSRRSLASDREGWIDWRSTFLPDLTLDDQIEDPQSCRLGEGTHMPHRTDAPGASILALALRDQTARPFQELAMHSAERVAEADAAGVVVVDEHSRADIGSERRNGRRDRVIDAVAGIDRDPDVVMVAHQ